MDGDSLEHSCLYHSYSKNVHTPVLDGTAECPLMAHICSLSSKNSLRTSLTTAKFRGLPGNGVIVAIATFSFCGCGRELATAQTISGRFGTSSHVIPRDRNGRGSALWNAMITSERSAGQDWVARAECCWRFSWWTVADMVRRGDEAI